ncbi:MAG TPA: DUF167 domain-containing protein [Candidatus Moranbacteria bacterium]|nr:DUF167 domain-containing protein [Candidatus Moranbacteria bacterium]
MRIYVEARPRSSQNKIERLAKNEYKVWLKASPVKGGANFELIKVLADYFGIAKSRVTIISGKTARKKIVEII